MDLCAPAKGYMNDIVYKTEKDGVVRGYDILTGELVRRSDDKPATNFPYNLTDARKVVDLIREGQTITALGKISGMPPASSLFRWIAMHPDFREAVEQARLDRAEVFHDKAIQAAEEVDNKDDVPAARLKIDTYKWAAEKGNKDRYGATKIDIAVKKSDIIVMDTGIDRTKVYDEPMLGKVVEISKEEGSVSGSDEGTAEDAGSLDGDTVCEAGEGNGDEGVRESTVSPEVPGDNTEADTLGAALRSGFTEEAVDRFNIQNPSRLGEQDE